MFVLFFKIKASIIGRENTTGLNEFEKYTQYVQYLTNVSVSGKQSWFPISVGG